MKLVLVQAPVLGYPDFSLPFALVVDSSLQGLEAILSQRQQGRRVVIAYASRGLRPSERNPTNYSSMKLEYLGLTWAIPRKFKDYRFCMTPDL